MPKEEENKWEEAQANAAVKIQAIARGKEARSYATKMKKKATCIDLFQASKKGDGVFAMFDKDGSNTVTLSEWREAFCMMDQNGDGVLTRKEWELLQEETGIFDAVPRKYFGQISKKEWDAAYMELDQDNSGTITVDEFMHARLTGDVPKPDKVLKQHGMQQFPPTHINRNTSYTARMDHALQSDNLKELISIYVDCYEHIGMARGGASSNTLPVERRNLDKVRIRIIVKYQKRLNQCMKEGNLTMLRQGIEELEKYDYILKLTGLPEVQKAREMLK